MMGGQDIRGSSSLGVSQAGAGEEVQEAKGVPVLQADGVCGQDAPQPLHRIRQLLAQLLLGCAGPPAGACAADAALWRRS